MTPGVLAAGPDAGNVVVDLDGCLYVAGEAVPGARAALREIEMRSLRVVAATNNSTRHPRTVAERIERITGFAIPPERVVTSGLAALRLIGPGDHPVLVVGEDGLGETLADAGVEQTGDPQAAATVLVGLDRSFDYERLRFAMEAILRGARFIATNVDATFPTGGVAAPGAGAIVAAVERATGVTPVYAGKPNDAMRSAIGAALGPGPTWIVGDRLDTDIAMGKSAGWLTVLVMTGVTRSTEDIPPDLVPDHVLASVAELADVIPPRGRAQ